MELLAPWRSLVARSLHLNRALPNARYFGLATVTANGEPRNRTVVFRGFLARNNAIAIATDLRSEKVAEIHHQPRGEICWYFPKTREQFRLFGRLILIDEACDEAILQQERQKLWQSLSEAARAQFAWPNPAQPRDENPSAFEPAAPNPEQPLDCFGLLLLEPERVDYLQLRGNPQNRRKYWQNPDLSWEMQEVNP